MNLQAVQQADLLVNLTKPSDHIQSTASVLLQVNLYKFWQASFLGIDSEKWEDGLAFSSCALSVCSDEFRCNR